MPYIFRKLFFGKRSHAVFFPIFFLLTLVEVYYFNPWSGPWNWIVFSKNSFVISPGLLHHLIRRDIGRLVNDAFTSNPIISLAQRFKNHKLISHYIKKILRENTNSKGNQSWNKRYTFPLVSDIYIKKSCFFNVELKFLINIF